MDRNARYRPEDVFEAFLYEQNLRGRKEWKRYDGALHLAFHKAGLEFPEEMGEFDFLIRTMPYSPTLERMHWEFRQAGIIGNENGRTVMRNASALKQPDEALRIIAGYVCNLLDGTQSGTQ